MSAVLQQAEYLSATDTDNLKRLIWICSTGLPDRGRWVSLIWGRLRAVTGVAKGDFEVRHIPGLTKEIRRILAYSELTRAISDSTSEIILCKYAAGDDSIGHKCVAKIGEAISNLDYSSNAAYDDWHEHDIKCFVERIATNHPTPYNVDEPEALA